MLVLRLEKGFFKKSYISWIHRKKELEREYKKFQKELEELYFKNNNL